METCDCLSREFGLSGESAGHAMAWAIRSLIDSLSRQKQERKRQLVDDETIRRGRELSADAAPSEAPLKSSRTKVARVARTATTLAPLRGALALPKQSLTHSPDVGSVKAPERKRKGAK
jgi:hypothetical protein